MSKTTYRDDHPDHAVVFNANVCFADGKVWFGDLDLSVDEAHLTDLAERTGEVVYVLFDRDGRFENEDAPLLDEAVYSVTPTGHTRVDHTRLERRIDGRLYERPRPRPPRWRRPGRPRVWRFWKIDTHAEHISDQLGDRRSRLVYVGRRGHEHRSALLVAGLHRWSRDAHGGWVELIWYPSAHRCWGPSFAPRLKWRRGRVRPFVGLRLTPGVSHELRVGVVIGPTDAIWG